MSMDDSGYPFGGLSAGAPSGRCLYCGWLQAAGAGPCQQCGGEVIPEQPKASAGVAGYVPPAPAAAPANPYAPPVASGVEDGLAFVGVPHYAGVGQRLLARCIDTFLLVIPMGLLVLFAEEETALAVAVGGGGLLALVVVQCMWIVQRGQSIGKRALKIRIVTEEGRPVGFVQAILLREVVPSILANFCGIFGLIDAVMIFRQDRRCLHDHMAKTIVIDAH